MNKLDNIETKSMNILNLIKKYYGYETSSPEENLLTDLTNIMKTILKEKQLFESSALTSFEKDRRLMLLFMRDLLPGINGKILESKENRQSPDLITVSSTIKFISWIFLGLLNISLLFYIYLFALNQTITRQNAWFQSFLIWITFDILVASTVVVLMIHIFIPMIAMRDIFKLKSKLLTDVVTFKKNLTLNESKQLLNKENSKQFNAANYLFISNAIAKLNPTLSLSPLILQFSTPWPKRCYKMKTKDLRKSYQNKFSFIYQAGTRILLFVVGNIVVLPAHLQDTLIHIITTSLLGYSLVLFLMLFRIYPLLPFLLILVIGIIVHFLIQINIEQTKLKKFNMIPEVEENYKMKELQIIEENNLSNKKELNNNTKISSSTTNKQLETFSNQTILLSRKQSMMQAEDIGLKLIQKVKQNINENQYDHELQHQLKEMSETSKEDEDIFLVKDNKMKKIDEIDQEILEEIENRNDNKYHSGSSSDSYSEDEDEDGDYEEDFTIEIRQVSTNNMTTINSSSICDDTSPLQHNSISSSRYNEDEDILNQHFNRNLVLDEENEEINWMSDEEDDEINNSNYNKSHNILINRSINMLNLNLQYNHDSDDENDRDDNNENESQVQKEVIQSHNNSNNNIQIKEQNNSNMNINNQQSNNIIDSEIIDDEDIDRMIYALCNGIGTSELAGVFT